MNNLMFVYVEADVDVCSELLALNRFFEVFQISKNSCLVKGSKDSKEITQYLKRNRRNTKINVSLLEDDLAQKFTDKLRRFRDN